jgi:mitochondrial chaperone BCS1
MDVWINFKNATKWQAEGIFRCFFPSAPSLSATTEADAEFGTDKGTQHVAQPRRKQHTHDVPLLSVEELEDLAKKFAEAIPEDEMSVASLQGYLLKNKVRALSAEGLCGDEQCNCRHAPGNVWKGCTSGSRQNVS